VELVEADDVVEKLAYAISNPVKDGLVDKLEHWPGPNSLAFLRSGEPLRAVKPRRYFRHEKDYPLTQVCTW
jgi:hypothetical protein